MRVAVTPNERRQGALVKATSTILPGQAREGLAEIVALNSELEHLGSLIMVSRARTGGVALAMLGRISEGIGVVESGRSRSGTR